MILFNSSRMSRKVWKDIHYHDLNLELEEIESSVCSSSKLPFTICHLFPTCPCLLSVATSVLRLRALKGSKTLVKPFLFFSQCCFQSWFGFASRVHSQSTLNRLGSILPANIPEVATLFIRIQDGRGYSYTKAASSWRSTIRHVSYLCTLILDSTG